MSSLAGAAGGGGEWGVRNEQEQRTHTPQKRETKENEASHELLTFHISFFLLLLLREKT